ncbi:MAG: hypothetical protein QOH46_116, partial [Solirubrobacteraceae bacterium]|nr:hypothetical protein [Solirubrobacteraceae bacterium]
MPTSTSTDPRATLPYAGLAGDVLASARQAAGTAAQTYLAGLDAVADAQRRMAAGTPLAPVSELLGVQVKLTRRVFQGFVTGETPASPGAVAEAVEHAAPAATRPAPEARSRKAAASARKGAATTRSASAKSTARPARKAASSPRKAAGPARPASSVAKPASSAVTTAAAAGAPAKAAVAKVAPAEPLSGYGALTAEQVIARLPEVSQATLKEIQAYETAQAARRTVLDRIDELTAHEPLP